MWTQNQSLHDVMLRMLAPNFSSWTILVWNSHFVLFCYVLIMNYHIHHLLLSDEIWSFIDLTSYCNCTNKCMYWKLFYVWHSNMITLFLRTYFTNKLGVLKSFYLIMKLNVHYQSSHSYPNKPNMLYKINEIKIYTIWLMSTNLQICNCYYIHILMRQTNLLSNTTKCDVICSTMK